MYLTQILLPLCDNDGHPFPQSMYLQVRDELTDRFRGITTYVRSPAEGIWHEGSIDPMKDEIVIYEVMAQELDRAWWQGFRGKLEQIFRQESVIVRASQIEVL